FFCVFFFFSSRRRHTRSDRDWSSDVCSSDLASVARSRKRRVVRSGVAGERGVTRDVSTPTLDALSAGAPTSVARSKVIAKSSLRSEERRVGKECKSRGAPYQ